MSNLLMMPATWPHLALRPEPLGTGSDPESVQRWFNELFGVDSAEPCDTPSLNPIEPKP